MRTRMHNFRFQCAVLPALVLLMAIGAKAEAALTARFTGTVTSATAPLAGAFGVGESEC